MYAGNADKITIEHDEGGFELHIHSEDAYVSFNIHAIAEALYDTVKREIGPWLYERDMAKASMPAVFLCNPDESGGYDISDPKHPRFHSTHADIYDNREGK